MLDKQLLRGGHNPSVAPAETNRLEAICRGADLRAAVYAHLTEAICALEEINHGITWNGEPTELHLEALRHIRAARAGLRMMELKETGTSVDHRAAAANDDTNSS